MTKRTVLLTAAIVVAAAAGAAAVVLTNEAGEPAAKPCDIPASAMEKPVPASDAIKVAEKGVSSSGLASMGAVLRNTSEKIAYRTRVALKVTVSVNGVAQGLQGPGMTMEIPVIMPGQQVGIGRPLVAVGEMTKVTSADVEVQTTTWLPRTALGSFTPVTDTYESMARATVSPPADVVRYRETSANCRVLTSRRTAVVFRDASGAIVGGDLVPADGKGNPAGAPVEPPASPSCEPGDRSTWIVPMQQIPREAEDARTALYSYCDLNSPPTDVNNAY